MPFKLPSNCFFVSVELIAEHRYSDTTISKFAVQKSLDEAQLLFDSLMQEYFG